jgi:hypothetical protein
MIQRRLRGSKAPSLISERVFLAGDSLRGQCALARGVEKLRLAKYPKFVLQRSPRMQSPVLIDTKWVRPCSADGNPEVCSKCLKESARWAVGRPPNNHFCCAHCFLYETPWGKENAARIGMLVLEVEASIGRSISDGGVVRENEADRILSSIVAVSGIALARAQRRLRDESPGS